MKIFKYIFFAVIIVVLIYFFRPSVFNAISMPIPKSLNQVNLFSKKFSINQSLEVYMSQLNIDNTSETYGVIIGYDVDKKVELRVIKFKGSKEAKNAYEQYKKKVTTFLTTNKIEFNIPFYGKYWTADIETNTFTLWQKAIWLIIIKGEDRHSVKKIESEFREFLNKNSYV